MKKRVRLLLLGIFSLSLFAFIILSSSKNDISEYSHKRSPFPKKEKKKISRSIASVNKNLKVNDQRNKKDLLFKGRLVQLNGHHIKLEDIQPVNKVRKDWKKLYLKRVTQHFDNEYKTSITHKKSLIFFMHGQAYNAEKVLVSITRPDGLKNRFEALIDSQTGRVINRWGGTRYEFKKPFTLEASPVKN